MASDPTNATGHWADRFLEPADLPDTETIKAKYRSERAKRMAADRTSLSALSGELAHYLDDPYTVAVGRAAVNDEVDALVVGAGFSGLMIAVQLKEAGLSRVRLVERAGDVGGVWYWNRYPGAMCDVESYIYLPLLEETGYIPRDKYSSASEILVYSKRIARHYDLYSLALFQTSVTRMRWDEHLAGWMVWTDRGDIVRARYVAVCSGVYSRPKFPALPGLKSFQGRSFHTSRWDYAYTGGDESGGLTGLADKRVGVVGTGATAIQLIPHVGRDALQTYVFQRTPSMVLPRNNRPTDPLFGQSLKPGWQRHRMINFTEITSGNPQPEDLIQDGWTTLHWRVRQSLDKFGGTREDAKKAKEELDFKVMEMIRGRIDALVEDPRTAERLKPYYPYYCLRPVFHDDYLATFNRPNVTLVDTEGRGIEQILPDGVIVAGRKCELDCLIFATGFDYEGGIGSKGFDIEGRHGDSLDGKWRQGISTLHGIMSRGFPNFFVMPGTDAQTTPTINLTHLILENAAHIAYIAREVEARGARCVDVSSAAEAAWVARVVAGADRRAFEGCTPSRFTNDGRLSERPLANSNYPGPAREFFEVLAAWRAAGNLPGLELQWQEPPRIPASACQNIGKALGSP